MRNILIIWVEPLNITGGGIHRTITNLIEFMPSRGYKVSYIYSIDDYNTFILPSKKNDCDNKIFSQYQLKEYILDNKIDIIIGQEAAFSDSLAHFIRKMNFPKIKFISQYHSTLLYMTNKLTRDYLKLEWQTNHDLKNRIGIIARWILYPIWKYKIARTQNIRYRYNYNTSDITLFLSEREIPLMKNILYGISPTKCTAIPNPLSWEKVASPDILKFKHKEVIIVSRIYNPEKRIDLALRVWKILQNENALGEWKLRIIGDGIHKEYLIQMAHKMNLKNVYWESNSNPIPFYEKASIFLFTSVAEGWALTLTESMQNGVVPIAFDSYPAIRDIITNGQDGFLIPPLNVNIMANKLKTLMVNEELRNTMALTGLQSCKRFAIDRVMDQWKEMLDKL